MKKKDKNMWSKNLPAHTPPKGMWEKIEARMDNDDANEAFRAQMAGLPEHEPPFSLWSRIEQGLARRRVAYLWLTGSGIAATLFIAFMLKGIFLPEPMKNQTVRSFTHTSKENLLPISKTAKGYRTGTSKDQKGQNTAAPQQIPQERFYLAEIKVLNAAPENPGNLRDISFMPATPELQEKSPALLPIDIKTATLKSEEPPTLSTFIPSEGTDKNVQKKDTLLTLLLARNSEENTLPPPSSATKSQKKSISIGFNYFPEPMTATDNGSSVYQTFAFMAKYQMPSIDLQTGLGISFQSVPMEYRTDYASFSNAYGYDRNTYINNGDTLTAALLNAGSVDISGKERSSFLYYTIGAGKRISSGKHLSTTLRVGAGFSLLLANQANPRGAVYDALKNQSNTFFGNTESNIPSFNRTHFDLITGFDFNYILHKRWSLSIEPTLKYYFNPIYTGDSRSFSTGLRTGILFKL